MDRNAILAKLKEAEGELRARGVARAALFGSMARDEGRVGSDIDIMVELAPEVEAGLDLYTYLDIVHLIEDMFPVRVDVADRKQLKPFVRSNVERDALYAF